MKAKEFIVSNTMNGKWWERMQNMLPDKVNILSIILYLDATTCDQLGKTSEHPVYLTLGNIPSWRRNSPDAKDNGFDLQTNNEVLWYFSYISILLGDLPENATQTLIYSSVNSKHPCHKYLIDNEDLNNLNLNDDQIELRTPELMKNIMQQGDLYKKDLCGQVAIDKLDKRLAAIPRFSGLKIFKHGLENIKRFTANEYQNMINSIEKFGAINSFTMETYEFLHKDYVKNPYRASNKHEAIEQIINMSSLTLKHLIQQSKKNKSQKITSPNGLLGKFELENFDGFFNDYNEKNSLAPEALLVFNNFLTLLNEFFDLDLNEELIANNTSISWYSYTKMAASRNYIRAISKYYNEPEFSNVLINMNVKEAENYNLMKEHVMERCSCW
ncbi:hypothetical protein C1645_827894 [Glomus cerebriforme]|uniref:Uncharacterized protein n=1 Tax=Glomus cerebriforme TaxID=658196 RepID=A0A397SX88_9GLOM|nr:hypothetical protein C1645_827894 [Glomus cerebriforme]